jgi:hypothetical protein
VPTVRTVGDVVARVVVLLEGRADS